MTLKIVVLSDLHIVPAGQLSQGLDTTERLRAGIAAINARHADADFVAIAGDLADCGDRASCAGREIAFASLTYTEPTNLTRGLRIGSMIQTRSEWTNEVTAALNGDKTDQEALDTAVARSNEIMARFAQTYAGKPFP